MAEREGSFCCNTTTVMIRGVGVKHVIVVTMSYCSRHCNALAYLLGAQTRKKNIHLCSRDTTTIDRLEPGGTLKRCS